jgi:hypothetical protein
MGMMRGKPKQFFQLQSFERWVNAWLVLIANFEVLIKIKKPSTVG